MNTTKAAEPAATPAARPLLPLWGGPLGAVDDDAVDCDAVVDELGASVACDEAVDCDAVEDVVPLGSAGGGWYPVQSTVAAEYSGTSTIVGCSESHSSVLKSKSFKMDVACRSSVMFAAQVIGR
jgi:hypothetical protein